MASTAHDIAEDLEDAVLGTVGTSIFAGTLPPTPDICIAVYEHPGSPQPVTWSGERPNIQIMVRHTAIETAHSVCDNIIARLHNRVNATIEGSTYHSIDCLGSPGYMGRDKLGRAVYSLNFTVLKGK